MLNNNRGSKPQNQYGHCEENQSLIQKTVKFSDYDESLSDTSLRGGFIRKVYGILTMQMMITVGFVYFCIIHKHDPVLH